MKRNIFVKSRKIFLHDYYIDSSIWIYNRWIYRQGEICFQFSLLVWTSFISKFVLIGTNCKYHFIKVHENLVQHPSNYLSIIPFYFMFYKNIFIHFIGFQQKFYLKNKKIWRWVFEFKSWYRDSNFSAAIPSGNFPLNV